MQRLAMIGLLCAPLAACAYGPSPDKVGQAIGRYYAAHAMEEDGRCPKPRIDSITERVILAEHGPERRFKVNYSYFDPSVDMETNWGNLFNGAAKCTGFAEREFSVEQTEIGYRVTSMGGLTRPDPAR